MYILLFKNSEVNYQVHPYFFLRRMLESKWDEGLLDRGVSMA